MDSQSVDLVKRTAQASLRYAVVAGVTLLIVNLLSKIPIIGIGFSCLYFFGVLGAAFGIAYLTAPKMTNLPFGQSKAMLALWIGLGVALPLTGALVIVNLIGSLFDIFTGSSSLLGKVFTVIGAIFLGLVGGVIISTVLAWLGSFFSLDRNPNARTAERPF